MAVRYIYGIPRAFLINIKISGMKYFFDIIFFRTQDKMEHSISMVIWCSLLIFILSSITFLYLHF